MISTKINLATWASRWHEFTDSREGGWTLEGAYTMCNQQSRKRKREEVEAFELVDLQRARSYLRLNFVLRNCPHVCNFIPRRHIRMRGYSRHGNPLVRSDGGKLITQKAQSDIRVSYVISCTTARHLAFRKFYRHSRWLMKVWRYEFIINHDMDHTRWLSGR